MKENIPLQTNEEILSIQGYEGLYSITNFGRVWSHKRFVPMKKTYRKAGGCFLKWKVGKRRYPYVNLAKYGKTSSYKIHILVATRFISNLLNLPEVNHKDGNKLNCKDDNLEWCTYDYNLKHAMENGLKRLNKSSRFYGVSVIRNLNNKSDVFRAYLRINGKHKHIGRYKTEIEAAQAYNNYVVKYKLNRPLNKIEV